MSNSQQSNNVKIQDPDYVPLWSFSSTRFWIGNIVQKVYSIVLAFILMFMVFCAINLRTNIGIAIVCMVNSTAYTSKAYDNGSTIIVESRNPECVNKNNQEGVEDLGYHVNFNLSKQNNDLHSTFKTTTQGCREKSFDIRIS